MTKSFDVHFNNSENSDSKGFAVTFTEALDYINQFNGTNTSYFTDYKGGTVSIVCNETGEEAYSTTIN